MDATNERKLTEQWVKKEEVPIRSFDPQEDMETTQQGKNSI
jgi:hypothetical protein